MKSSKNSEKVRTLIDKFIAVRKEKGVTQASLAEKSGYSQQVISRIENKSSIPQIDTLCTLIDVLGYEITYKSKVVNTKKEVKKPVIKEIDLSDIPDDNVITYTELKEYLDNNTETNNADNMKVFDCYIHKSDDFICVPEVKYHADAIENDIAEIREMFNKGKISRKRLERIQEDFHYAMETFQDMLYDIEFVADTGIEALFEIIDDVTDYELTDEE